MIVGKFVFPVPVNSVGTPAVWATSVATGEALPVNLYRTMKDQINVTKKKGGRPRKDEGELRSHHVKVGFTDLEFDTVEYKAQVAGKRTANYLHDAALSANVKAHISDEQVELVRNVARMGNNVNQIAHAAHLAGFSLIRQKCETLLGELSLLIRRILRGGDLTT